MPKCKQCLKDFMFDNEHGYANDLCSPYCDGVLVGMKRKEAEIARLTERLAAAEGEMRDSQLATHVLWDWICERYPVDSLPAWRTRWEWLDSAARAAGGQE